MKNFIKKLLSNSEEVSSKRFMAIQIIYTLIFAMLTCIGYAIFKDKILDLPEYLVYALAGLGASLFGISTWGTVSKAKANGESEVDVSAGNK